MATFVDGTCSECFAQQNVELNPRRPEIRCAYCGHSVPMFEKHDIGGIRKSLAAERGKALVALCLFAGSVFFFVLYVFINSREDLVEIEADDGAISGQFVKRDADSLTIIPLGSGGEETWRFGTAMASKIEQIRQEKPYLTEEQAAEQAGNLYVKVKPHEPSMTFLFVLAVLVGLGAIAFSAIATESRVVCEF